MIASRFTELLIDHPRAHAITEFQSIALTALFQGELSAEAAAGRCGYEPPSLAPYSSHRPTIWWGRIMSGMPVGLVLVRWSAKDKRHYYRLSPEGMDLAAELALSKLAQRARQAA